MSPKIKHLYKFENFVFDAEMLSLWKNGKLVSVPPKALEILFLLVETPGDIVAREKLLD